MDRDLRNSKKLWSKPALKRINIGAAETGGPGINDGGPVGNARS